MNVKLCPECGHLAYYDSYFGTFMCENCSWREDINYNDCQTEPDEKYSNNMELVSVR